jgi:ATP-dependent 26S proteasome regulatory subunit
VIDFPFPDEQQRADIWKVLFPSELPRADDIIFEAFARQYKLAGGNIRNVIVQAAFLAASNGEIVTNAHLLHGVKREMQKMGRLIDDKDLTLEL